MPRLDSREVLAIYIGGCLGAVARVTLISVLPHTGGWPWPTFTANIAGTFMLGYVVTRLQERLPLSSYRRPLIGTGFCGALTTFSTFQLELLNLLEKRDVILSAEYALASLGGGFLAVALATSLVRRVRTVT